MAKAIGRPSVLSGEIRAKLARCARHIAHLLACTIATPLAVLAASSTSGTPSAPTFSWPGFLIAWFFCNGKKRNPIGGWLLFFYWQLYSSLLITAMFFGTNIESYVPENFENSGQFVLFLASTVPGLVLFAVKFAVGTLLLSARSWDMLKLLRWVMMAELAVDGLGAIIVAAYFPDNLALSFLTIVPNLLWLVYFFRSARIKHIFYRHDWDLAVNVIHPLKLKMVT